jgi:hypothetical protein
MQSSYDILTRLIGLFNKPPSKYFGDSSILKNIIEHGGLLDQARVMVEGPAKEAAVALILKI